MAAARKPRNFTAMREDRVRAMATSAFGREFSSKKTAIEALATLPVDKQHALKKPESPERAAKVSSPARSFEHMKRGGTAPAPSPDKLLAARPEAVQRLATATTGIPARSKAQALALLAKYGSTDISKAAGSAIGRGYIRKQDGPTKPELRKAYRDKFGFPARSDYTAKQLKSVLGVKPAAPAAAPQKAQAGRGLGMTVAPLMAGTLALQRYMADRDAGASPLTAGATAAVVGGATFVAAALLRGYALPVFAGVGAARGAMQDRNVIRGAARGALAGMDVTTLVTGFSSTDKRGALERGFDRVFGGPTPPGMRGVIMGSHIDDTARRADVATASGRAARAAGSPSVAIYSRTYTKGPKAGTTETVRLA